MTLRLIEGFDWLTTTSVDADVQGYLADAQYYFGSGVAAWDIVTDTAFSFGKALAVNYQDAQFNSLNKMLYPVPARQEGYQGRRMKVSPNHTGYVGMTFFDAVGGDYQVSISCRPNGVIWVWRGQPFIGTLLAVSDPGVFYDNEWFFLEAYVKVDSIAGEVEIRVNTKTVISLVSSDTQNTTRALFDMVGFTGRPSTNTIWIENQIFDDLYYCDTDGSVNNGFLGNVRVKTSFTTANGSNIDFLIGGSAPAATNWQSVQNILLNQTKFVYSPTSGDYDLYAMDPNVNAPYVHAVQVRSSMWQDDATQRIGRNLLKTGAGTLIDGVDIYLNQTPSVYRDIIELNPDTGVFFTGTEANATQAGVKVES